MEEGKMAGWDAGTSGTTRTWNARGSKSRPPDLASDQKIKTIPFFQSSADLHHGMFVPFSITSIY